MKIIAVLTAFALIFLGSAGAQEVVGTGKLSLSVEKNNVIIRISTYFPYDEYHLNMMLVIEKYSYLYLELHRRGFRPHFPVISDDINFFTLGLDHLLGKQRFYLRGISRGKLFEMELPTDDDIEMSKIIVDKIQQLYPFTNDNAI